MNCFRPLLAVLLLIGIPATVSAADFSGLPVTTIILKDDLGKPLTNVESLLPLIELKPGDPFSRQAVRKGITYLYLEGKFSDIRVDTYPENGGVRLEYTLTPVTIVDSIVLRGNRALADRFVRRDAARGIEGRELREDTFPDIRANIQALYQAEGFYNVRVSFRHEPAPDPHRAVLFIYITEPMRTLIERILFKGNTVFTENELLTVMQNRPGRPLRTNVLIEDDLEAIRKKYADAGYPAAAPGPVSMSFRNELAFLEIGGVEGPKVTVSFSGIRKFCEQYFPDLLYFDPDNGRSDVVMEEQCAAHFRDLLLIWSEHDVSDTVIESSMDKIRNVYRDLGYPDVKVDVKKTEAPGSLDLAFTVQEGQKVTVGEVRVEGNAVFTVKQIRDMMATRESGWFRSRHFREDILEKDVDSITDHYVAAGYLAANVKRTFTRTADGSKAVIDLKITEGGKTLMGNVSFEGNAAITSEELAGVLKLKTAAPFSERLLEEDRYRILSLYSAKGYLYTRIEIERKPASAAETAGPEGKSGAIVDTGPEVVPIRYRIVEDRQVTVGKVILRGNVKTRDAVILRELEPRTGEPYNYESLLKSQQRVYRYGYFSLAKFEPVHPNEKEYVKDMLFTVEERPAGAVEFGVGYGTLDKLRGFVEISHRNLWGTARFASLRFEGSDILKREAFTYQEPWFLGYRYLESKFILAWSDSKRINEQTREIYYQTRKKTASYGVERSKDHLKISLTYQLEDVNNYNVLDAAELSTTKEESGKILISSLNPAVILDERDDPFNPTKGSLHGVNIKEALKALGSEVEFTKPTVQSTWYLPAAEHVVLALSGRAGRAWPHHDTLEIPINERFYLGGSTTVRGYIQDSVGPYNFDTARNRVPTGGDRMVQFNAEIRLSASGGSGFVIFTDAGNVWVDKPIRLNDLRASYGAGFRYHTPVGPLRVDYGQKIHRQSGESPGELHFSIGQAF
jgi:outer membrane protein insertion porin family